MPTRMEAIATENHKSAQNAETKTNRKLAIPDKITNGFVDANAIFQRWTDNVKGWKS